MTHSHPSLKRGFTLMEVLIALGIFGLGAITLLHVQSENVRTVTALKERVIADIVAENVLVDSYLQDPAGPLLQPRGVTDVAGQSWQWSRTVRATPNAALQRLTVDVRREGEETVLGAYSAFRRTP